MKQFLSLFTLAAFAAIGMSQAAPAKQKTKVKCAVMPSHSVEIASATKRKMFSDYKGRRYFFCCGGCVPKFKKDPAKYAKAESIPIPKK